MKIIIAPDQYKESLAALARATWTIPVSPVAARPLR
jgi:glycerate kinase